MDTDQKKIDQSRQLIADTATAQSTICLAAQTLAEFRHVLCKKLRLSGEAANARLALMTGFCDIHPTDGNVLNIAFNLAAQHNFQTFDAIILAAATEANCDTLYSEDMQHGFAWRGVEIVNPFL